MFELELIPSISLFLAGGICGAAAILIFNKVSSGNTSPAKLKKQMADYQDQVEAHFETTSEKFKNMAGQYQDLYQHLSVGATTLCRPENIAPGLTDESNPLAKPTVIEKQNKNKDKIEDKKSTTQKDAPAQEKPEIKTKQ